MGQCVMLALMFEYAKARGHGGGHFGGFHSYGGGMSDSYSGGGGGGGGAAPPPLFLGLFLTAFFSVFVGVFCVIIITACCMGKSRPAG